MTTEKKKGVSKDTVYLVPHTHYDAIWVFTKEDYLYINLMLILKEVAELVEKTDYKFMIEQTFLLEAMETRSSEVFAKIAKGIKEGKIEIADGEYLMADAMIPEGETLVREILHGKRYVKAKFGMDVPVMWQADSFGLNAQLPQIYKKSGYKYVAFRRGSAKREPTEFLWESLDGTRILAHWMPLGYRAGLDLTKLDDSYEKLKAVAATSHILMPSGSGVTLPQPETSEVVKAWNKKSGNVAKMKIATPREFFDALAKEIEDKDLKMEVRKGEMYSGKYSEVFPNCCSSRMWIKQGLCEYENGLLSCERWCTIGHFFDVHYPFDELRNCWRMILYMAFHDVAPGTGMDSGYDEVKQYQGFITSEISNQSANVHTKLVDKETEVSDVEAGGGDIVVFNSLSWEVKNWIEMDLNFDLGKVVAIKGLMCGKEEIDVEVIKFARYEDDSLRYARIGFVPTVPAMGYKAYSILERKPRRYRYDKSYIMVRGNTIENRFFGVVVDPATGLIDVSLDGKEAGREIICSANELVLEEEAGDLYYHRQMLAIPLKTEKGEGVKYGSFSVKNFYIDNSPLRRVINVETNYFSLRWPYRLTDKQKPLIWRHNFLECTKKIIVYKDIPRIDFVTTIENKHPRARLRVRFSTDMKSLTYACGTQFGVVSRPTDQWHYKPKEKWVEEPCGAFPSLKWLDYSDRNKGLTVIHSGIPENEVRDGDIYLTLLRSVSMLSSNGKSGPAIPVPDAEELKRYTFNYSIYPHVGDWRDASAYKHAYEFNCALYGLQLSSDKKLPLKRSFLKIEPDNVILSAMKMAEDEDGAIIRFYETKGTETDAEIILFKEPKTVKVVNMLEEEDEEVKKGLKKTGERIQLKMNPFEIVTLKVKF
ncbi:alpha-mannosidase [Methanophagales archaeon]|nr:alpha-mannosidase [Methanophagales archaeon]